MAANITISDQDKIRLVAFPSSPFASGISVPGLAWCGLCEAPDLDARLGLSAELRAASPGPSAVYDTLIP